MIVFIVLAGSFSLLVAGIMQNVRYGDALEKYNNPVFLLLSGIGSCVAIAGLILLAFGKPFALMTVIGLAAAVLFQLPALKKASDDLAMSKKVVRYKTFYSEEESDSNDLYKNLGPLPVLLRMTLVGIGKAMVMVLYITIIGIPLYQGAKARTKILDKHCAQERAQAQLKSEYERTQIETAINLADRETKQ